MSIGTFATSFLEHFGLRAFGGWQSEADWNAFEDGRLHPVVHPLLESMLGFVPPEPDPTVLDVIDAWTDRHPG